MTLTFELDLDRVKMNQLDRCLGLRSFSSKFVVGTHTHHQTDCSTWTTEVVSKRTWRMRRRWEM